LNALLAFIPKPVLAGLLVAAVFVASFQTWRVGGLKAENARFEIAVDQCKATNNRNKQAIETVKLINQQCIDGRRTDERAQANAVVAWTVERELLKAKANEKGDNIVEVFREPTCADFAKVNIAAICPGMVDGLRRRAENHHGIQNRNN
jgi:hypothetical protein